MGCIAIIHHGCIAAHFREARATLAMGSTRSINYWLTRDRWAANHVLVWLPIPKTGSWISWTSTRESPGGCTSDLFDSAILCRLETDSGINLSLNKHCIGSWFPRIYLSRLDCPCLAPFLGELQVYCFLPQNREGTQLLLASC